MTAIYQDLILAHAKAPRHFGPFAAATARRTGTSPLCGDEVELALALSSGGALTGAFTSKGCALCRASASLMMAHVIDVPPASAQSLADSFRAGFAAATPLPAPRPELEALYELKPFATRRRCVLLPWETLAETLEDLR